MASAQCLILDPKTSNFKLKPRFNLLLAPVSKYPKISLRVRQFLTDVFGVPERASIVKLFADLEKKTDWRAKVICVMAYQNQPGSVYGESEVPEPPDVATTGESSSSLKTQIISAVVFSNTPKDGCYIHYVGTLPMSPSIAKTKFGCKDDDDSIWSLVIPQVGPAPGPVPGSFLNKGLARFLLHLVQVCGVFDPMSESLSTWLDSSKGTSNFFSRMGFFSDGNNLPPTFSQYFRPGRMAMHCATPIPPFRQIRLSHRQDPFTARLHLPGRDEYWGIIRDTGHNHCYIASVILLLCHSFSDVGKPWLFAGNHHTPPLKESVLEHQSNLRTAFSDISSTLLDAQECSRIQLIGIREKFEAFLNVLSIIPSNLQLDSNFRPQPPFTTQSQEDVTFFLFFLLLVTELSPFMYAVQRRKRFVHPMCDMNSQPDPKQLFNCDDDSPRFTPKYYLTVHRQEGSTMSDCIDKVLGLEEPNPDFETGVRRRFPDAPKDWNFQSFLVVNSCGDNSLQDRMPKRLVITTTQGDYEDNRTGGGKKSTMIQGKVADFVATFSVGIFQYVSIAGHDAAITNRRLEMVLKGFIHYIPKGKGDNGHYITFLHYHMGSWVVIDDHQVFIVTDTFAHYFAPLARIFVYEHVPEGSSLPEDSFYKER